MTLNDLNLDQLARYQAQAKKPLLCALLEVVGLCVGLGGLGIMLGGRVGLGMVALLAYWGVGAVCLLLGLSGGGVLLVPVVWLVWAAMSVSSASQTARSFNTRLVYVVAGREPPASGPGGVLGAVLAVLGILVGLAVAVALVVVFVLLSEGLPG